MNERSSYEKLLDKYLDGKYQRDKTGSQDFSRQYENSNNSIPRPRSASGRKKTIMEMLHDGEFVAASKQIVSLCATSTQPKIMSYQKMKASSTDTSRTTLKPLPLTNERSARISNCSLDRSHFLQVDRLPYTTIKPAKKISSYERYNPINQRVPNYTIRSEKPPVSEKEMQFLYAIKDYVPDSICKTERNPYDTRKKQSFYGASDSMPIYSDPDSREKSHHTSQLNERDHLPQHSDKTDVRCLAPIKTTPEPNIQQKTGKRMEFLEKRDEAMKSVVSKPRIKSAHPILESKKCSANEKQENHGDMKVPTIVKGNNIKNVAQNCIQHKKANNIKSNKADPKLRSLSTDSYHNTEQIREKPLNKGGCLVRNMSEELIPSKDTQDTMDNKHYDHRNAGNERPNRSDNKSNYYSKINKTFHENKNTNQRSTTGWDKRSLTKNKPESSMLQNINKITPVDSEKVAKYKSKPVNISKIEKNDINNIQFNDIPDINVIQVAHLATPLTPAACHNNCSSSFNTVVPTTCISPYITEPNMKSLDTNTCNNAFVKIPPFLVYIGEQLKMRELSLPNGSCLTEGCNITVVSDEPKTLFMSVSPITSMSPYITGPCQLDSNPDNASKTNIYGTLPKDAISNSMLELNQVNKDTHLNFNAEKSFFSCDFTIPIFYKIPDEPLECQTLISKINVQQCKRKPELALISNKKEVVISNLDNAVKQNKYVQSGSKNVVPATELNYCINRPGSIKPPEAIIETNIITSSEKVVDIMKETKESTNDTSPNTQLNEVKSCKVEQLQPIETKSAPLQEHFNYKQKIESLRNYCNSLDLTKDKRIKHILSLELVHHTKEDSVDVSDIENPNYDLKTQPENKVPELEVKSLFHRKVTVKHKNKDKTLLTNSNQIVPGETNHKDSDMTELFKAANNIKSAYKTLISRIRNTNIRELEVMENKIGNILDSNVFVNEADIGITAFSKDLYVQYTTKNLENCCTKFEYASHAAKNVDQIDGPLNSESNNQGNSIYNVPDNVNIMTADYDKNVLINSKENKKNNIEKEVNDDLPKTSNLTKTQCENTSVNFNSTDTVVAAVDKNDDTNIRSFVSDFKVNRVSCDRVPVVNKIPETRDVMKMKSGKNINAICKSSLKNDVSDIKKETTETKNVKKDKEKDLSKGPDFQTITSKSKIFSQFPSFKTIPPCLDSSQKLSFEDISNYVMAIISIPSEAYEKKKNCFTTRHLSHVIEDELMEMDIDESNRLLKKIVNCEIKNIPVNNQTGKVAYEKISSSSKKYRKILYKSKEKPATDSETVASFEIEAVKNNSNVGKSNPISKENVVVESKQDKTDVKECLLENNQNLNATKYDKKKSLSPILTETKAIRKAIVLLSDQNFPTSKTEGMDSTNTLDSCNGLIERQTDTKTIIDRALKKVITVQNEVNNTNYKDSDDGIRMLLEMRNKWCGLETRLDSMRFEHKKRERVCDEKLLKLAKVKIEKIRARLNDIIRKKDDQNKKIDDMRNVVQNNINKLRKHQDDTSRN